MTELVIIKKKCEYISPLGEECMIMTENFNNGVYKCARHKNYKRGIETWKQCQYVKKDGVRCSVMTNNENKCSKHLKQELLKEEIRKKRSPNKNEDSKLKCNHIMAIGKRKGEACGRNVFKLDDDCKCYFHSKVASDENREKKHSGRQTTKIQGKTEEIKTDQNGAEEEEIIGDEECNYIMKVGKKKGKCCKRKVFKSDNNQKCYYHSEYAKDEDRIKKHLGRPVKLKTESEEINNSLLTMSQID